MGLKDYIEKNNFPGVVIGISGGIDSAFSACVAVDALGSDKVKGIMMPSKYTSNASVEDATLLGKNLNIEMISLSIEEAALAYESTLKNVFEGTQQDITEENIQSRIRGMLLMAYSNKFGYMVMTNGNKSERWQLAMRPYMAICAVVLLHLKIFPKQWYTSFLDIETQFLQ